ncbi:hypothetical protein D9M68_19960 [compost metagenome]
MALTDADFAALDEMDKNVNTRLRESEVVKHLLPHLIPDPENPNQRPVEIYAAAAGSPMRMIDVVSDRDNAKILYTIPPLIAPTPMIIRTMDASPASDVGALAAQFDAEITVNHPGAVIDNFVQRLMHLNYTPSDAISVVYSMMWAQIYRRYNIPLERLFGEHAPAFEKALGIAAENQPSAVQGTNFDDLDQDDVEPM